MGHQVGPDQLGPCGGQGNGVEAELPAEWTLAPTPGSYIPPSLPSFRLEASPSVRAAFAWY